MKRWIIDLADTIDIYITARFNLRPKQRTLEYMMDHFQDPYVDKCIQEALENENEGTIDKGTDRRTKGIHVRDTQSRL
jgi:hypothetical protein